jgi:hypothetical protein
MKDFLEAFFGSSSFMFEGPDVASDIPPLSGDMMDADGRTQLPQGTPPAQLVDESPHQVQEIPQGQSSHPQEPQSSRVEEGHQTQEATQGQSQQHLVFCLVAIACSSYYLGNHISYTGLRILELKRRRPLRGRGESCESNIFKSWSGEESPEIDRV